MDSHTRRDTDLHAHGLIPTASTIRPIENWTTEDVWEYLLKMDWVNGMPNLSLTLIKTYRYYIEMLQGRMSCYPRRQPANMCWKQIWLLTCTVVSEDKSLNQMIETDKEIYDVKALALLSKFRDRLRDERNMYRVKGRNRQGRIK